MLRLIKPFSAFIFSAVFAASAYATDVDLVGLFPGKALLVVDGNNPKAYSVGQTIVPGVKLISAENGQAVIDFGGKRQTISIGSHTSVGGSGGGGSGSATIYMSQNGHFYAEGQINGVPAKMLVDTGATFIAIPATQASKFKLSDYQTKGRQVLTNTANGIVPSYMMVIDTVKVGGITLHQVEANINPGLNQILLGNSFLNRTEMKRESNTLTLKKRF